MQVEEKVLKFCGKEVSGEELQLIIQLAEDFGGISRTELADTVCELLNWKRPNGRLKTVECRQFLEELAEEDLIRLPQMRQGKPKNSRAQEKRKEAEPEEEQTLTGSLKEIGPISLELVKTPEHREQWKHLFEHHHQDGFKVPFGANLCYLVKAGKSNPRVVACIQFSSPTWRLDARDRWIGWDHVAREAGLSNLVQNSRFLMLPFCEVNGLAAHILKQAAKRVPKDWLDHFGFRPILLEAILEKSNENKAFYEEAKWTFAGETRGKGRPMEGFFPRRDPAKLVYVYPLESKAREKLTGRAA